MVVLIGWNNFAFMKKLKYNKIKIFFGLQSLVNTFLSSSEFFNKVTTGELTNFYL
jgi:hypothetical protein